MHEGGQGLRGRSKGARVPKVRRALMHHGRQGHYLNNVSGNDPMPSNLFCLLQSPMECPIDGIPVETTCAQLGVLLVLAGFAVI